MKEREHEDACVTLCTDYDEDDETGHCTMQHHCWCGDGHLTFAEYQAKYYVQAEP